MVLGWARGTRQTLARQHFLGNIISAQHKVTRQFAPHENPAATRGNFVRIRRQRPAVPCVWTNGRKFRKPLLTCCSCTYSEYLMQFRQFLCTQTKLTHFKQHARRVIITHDNHLTHFHNKKKHCQTVVSYCDGVMINFFYDAFKFVFVCKSIQLCFKFTSKRGDDALCIIYFMHADRYYRRD